MRTEILHWFWPCLQRSKKTAGHVEIQEEVEKMKWWLLICLFMVFLTGCAMYQPLSDVGNATNFSLNGTWDNRTIGRPNCGVMLCNSGYEMIGGVARWLPVSWYYWLFGNRIKDYTLYRGECWFTNMSPSDIDTRINGTLYRLDPDLGLPPESWADADKEIIKFFMYGQGPTFAEFDEANAYCLNNMSVVVKWMLGNSTDLPYVGTTYDWERRLLRSRAECYLRAGVMPVYVFHTNSDNIDSGNIDNFADALVESGEMGPVTIDPEFSYDLSKPGVVSALVDSVRNISASCSRCLIMLSPPEEDFASLSAVLEHPVWGEEMNNTIDIIGQGWTFTKDENCSYYQMIIRKSQFSKRILSRYNKPTFWAYVAISNTTNVNNSCTWDEQDVMSAMDLIYSQTPALVSAGGIGIAYYQYLDSYGPFIGDLYNCTKDNCSYGLIDRFDIATSQKQPMFNMWFRRCNQYYQLGDNFSRVPIVYNYYGENGSSCELIGHLGTYRMNRVTTPPEDMGTTAIRPEELYNCDRCFSALENTVHGNYDTYMQPEYSDWFNHIFKTGAYPGFYDDIHLGITWNHQPIVQDCDIYRASIRKYSETGCKWEMDPTFVRAVVRMDSGPGFDRCTVHYAPISNNRCNPNNFLIIPDPDGICPDTRNDLRYNVNSEECEPNTGQPGWAGWEQCKPCTYGLMRCDAYPSSVATHDKSSAYGCGSEDFNPYDVQDGLCCGVNKLCRAMEDAATWAYTTPGVDDKLRLQTTQDTWQYVERDKRTVLLLTLAVYQHHGDVSVLNSYFNHWDRTRWCPNSRTDLANPDVVGHGPEKAFIWSYCYVFNDTNVTWDYGITNDPWDECTFGKGYTDTTCQLSCCNTGVGPLASSLYLPHFESLAPNDLEYPNVATYHNACTDQINQDCCDPIICQSTYTANTAQWSNPLRMRCNAVGNCCGGSFPEHMCCMNSYPCGVMDYHNQTVYQCDVEGFCRRPDPN